MRSLRKSNLLTGPLWVEGWIVNELLNLNSFSFFQIIVISSSVNLEFSHSITLTFKRWSLKIKVNTLLWSDFRSLRFCCCCFFLFYLFFFGCVVFLDHSKSSDYSHNKQFLSLAYLLISVLSHDNWQFLMPSSTAYK